MRTHRRCVLKADPSRQWRLLDLQAIDTRLDQIAHARANLPQLAAIEAARRELAALDTDIVNARTAAGDVQRELTKSEQDVQLVRDRAARNQARLDSGQGSAKDLQALQHELASLARRQSELEDIEIEVMERSETLTQARRRAREHPHRGRRPAREFSSRSTPRSSPTSRPRPSRSAPDAPTSSPGSARSSSGCTRRSAPAAAASPRRSSVTAGVAAAASS